MSCMIIINLTFIRIYFIILMIHIIIRNISDYDDRITWYACARPSTASEEGTTDRIMLVEEAPIGYQSKRSNGASCAIHARASAPIIRTAHTNM